jgi:hydrogenase nickel incorporation protein HypA/HybF
MHEITLCHQAIELIDSHARQHGASRVTAVWLEVGAFSCVEASALTFCFELVCRGTLAEGCELHLHQQDAECWCYDCQQHINLLMQRVRICPRCEGNNLRIVADDGVHIKRVEINQEINYV